MTSKEIYFLKSKGLNLYAYTDEDLSLLFTTVKEELDSRQEVKNKKQKLELAEKVEAETGNDQHVDEIKKELFLARQMYAQRISNFDEYKYYPGYVHYNDSTGLPYGVNEEDDRLRPIEDARPQPPQWQITTIEEDGTERVLGYS